MCETGAKSLNGSYGSFWNSTALFAIVLFEPMNSVSPSGAARAT
jgi:hypothetical protein